MPLALFDLDNTLADRERAFLACARLLLTQHERPEEHVPWLVQADGDGLVPRHEFLAAVRDHLHLAASVDDLLRWYSQTYPTCYVPEPESVEALCELKDAGWLLGIVTNGRTATQLEKVRRTGLDAVVDVVCVSEDLGVRKPEPAIFHEAARRCGAPLSGWMVGDSPAADVGGGAGVGLRTAWIHRQRAWNANDGAPPDLVAARIAEVTAHLLRDPVRHKIAGALDTTGVR